MSRWRDDTGRVYCAVGMARILYIGHSSDPDRRWATHRMSSPWAGLVSELHIAHEMPVGEARSEEHAMIRRFRPLFNIQSNPDFAELDPPARRREYARRLAALLSEHTQTAVPLAA